MFFLKPRSPDAVAAAEGAKYPRGMVVGGHSIGGLWAVEQLLESKPDLVKGVLMLGCYATMKRFGQIPVKWSHVYATNDGWLQVRAEMRTYIYAELFLQLSSPHNRIVRCTIFPRCGTSTTRI